MVVMAFAFDAVLMVFKRVFARTLNQGFGGAILSLGRTSQGCRFRAHGVHGLNKFKDRSSASGSVKFGT